MKLKHLFILLFAAMLFSSCHGDPNITTFYVYGNATDKTITINCYMSESSEDGQIADILKNQLTIEPGEEVSLRFSDFLGTMPFEYYRYITVSNGVEKFTLYYTDRYGTLYDNDIYTTKKIKNDKVYFKYVFTDKDFIDAEPVE